MPPESASASSATDSGKTSEQLAKEKRIEELKSESLITDCYRIKGPDFATATPLALLVSVAVIYFIFRRQPRRNAPSRDLSDASPNSD